MQLTPDAETEERIERHKAHLPDGKDLTLLVLKGHLLVEEGLDDLIAAGCPQPQHILDRKPKVGFAMKARIAQGLSGHLLFHGLWPMIEALNTLRNDLAHNLDSPQLKPKIVAFMTQRQAFMKVLADSGPVDVSKWEETVERLRMDISLLVSQLTGGALALRTVVQAIDPWKAMVDEMNKA